MKRFLSVFLLTGAFVLFYSCEHNSPLAPDLSESNQSVEAESKIACKKKGITKFTGTSKPVQPLAPGTMTVTKSGIIKVKGQINEWYDEATDPRVTGQSIWVINQKINPDGTGKVWGTAEINVDNAECVGKWKIKWTGKLSPEGLIARAVGHGKEGDEKG